MKLTITNNGLYPVPIMSADGEGLADSLEPSEAYELTGDQLGVVIIGNKPSVTDQIQSAFQTLANAVRELLTKWQSNNNRQGSAADAMVKATIVNNGENGVRIILGDGVTDVNVPAGERWEGEAWGYLELRELGLVQQDPNQHEAA